MICIDEIFDISCIIMNGDLLGCLLVVGNDDEFDWLVVSFNVMFDWIELLMGLMKDVIDNIVYDLKMLLIWLQMWVEIVLCEVGGEVDYWNVLENMFIEIDQLFCVFNVLL